MVSFWEPSRLILRESVRRREWKLGEAQGQVYTVSELQDSQDYINKDPISKKEKDTCTHTVYVY